MPKTSPIILSLTTSRPTHDWHFGQQVLHILYDSDLRLRPERIGFFDSDMRKKYPCATVDDVRPFWALHAQGSPDIPEADVDDQFYWRRSRPLGASGSFMCTSTDKAGKTLSGSVLLQSKYDATVDIVSLFKKWCILYQPDQGYLHHVTKPELEYDPLAGVELLYPAPPDQKRAEQARSDWSHFKTGHFGVLQAQKTFNLGAFNVLSKTRMNSTTAQKLVDAGFTVTEFETGYIIEVVASLAAVKQDFKTFSERRHRVKTIIGMDMFEIKNEPIA
mmetsp:Transcript_24059/g.44298  ORF Transcript_24059/g.44298 Transcript_24059/m.44298 type:complete len:275 (-) Transcript_24059:7506-8330(-)